MIDWLYVHLGIVGSGPYYGFWSGFGSDITELAILGGMISLYRKHTCHVSRCWRLGRHPVAGTGYTTCKSHHPVLIDAPVTASDIADARQAAQDG